MWFLSAAKGGTDSVFRPRGGKQAGRLGHPLLASQPPQFKRIEPGTLGRHGAGEQAHALPGLLHRRKPSVRRPVLGALLLAIILWLAAPSMASAHAHLVQADPAPDG